MPADIGENLLPVAFEGETFPVISLSTDWGHDGVQHSRLGQDGVDIQTVGRKARQIKFRAAFIDDLDGSSPDGPLWPTDLWPNGYDRFIEKLEQHPIGEFTHPTKGTMQVHVDSVSEPIEAQVRSGVYVDVTLTEHMDSRGFSPSTTQPEPPAERAARHAEEADGMIEGVADRGLQTDPGAPASRWTPPPVLSYVNAALDFIEGAQRTVSEVRSNFNTALALLNGNLQYADVGGLVGHEYRRAIEGTIAALWDAQALYNRLRLPRTFTVPQDDMTWARIAAHPAVYLDASKGPILRAANPSVQGGVFVPAGTEIKVPALG